MRSDRLAAAMLAAALGVPAAGAATAPPAAASAAQDQMFVDGYVGWMAHVLAVPATPDLDPPLRDAMAALTTEHLARLRKLVAAWIAEEHAHAGAQLTTAALDRAIRNRVVNEIALWRLESPGADYDAAFTRALLKPGVCNKPARDSYIGVLMNWLQAVPPADRATVLAGERTLLSHWGQARASLPPRPAKTLSTDEDETITRLRSGDAVPDVPMPPILADSVFKGQLASADGAVTCALHQWGLAQALKRGDAPAMALAAWRYDMIRTAGDWSRTFATPPRDAAAYPELALAAGVSGVVQVRVTTDAQGRFASAAVARRTLVVPGVTGNPPAAFDTIFDKASLAQAAQQFKPLAPRADGAAAGPATATMNIDWKLP